jgi:hypothetical protein
MRISIHLVIAMKSATGLLKVLGILRFYPQTFVVAGSVRYSASVQPIQTENSVSDLFLQTQADKNSMV